MSIGGLPPYEVTGTVMQAVILSTGRVATSQSPLKIDVSGFKYNIGGLWGVFDGAVAQVVTDDDTSYVYLAADGTLVINTTGFPTGAHIPLARVTAANGEIVTINEERVLMVSSSTYQGTCRITYPIDGDVRGGDVSASSNNEFPSLLYAGDGTDTEGRNRLIRRPPQNYVSGDLVLRLYYSHGAAPGNNKSSYWYLKYAFRSADEDLGTYDGQVGLEVDHTGQDADHIYTLDLVIPAAAFNKSKDLMALYLAREHSNPLDTLTNGVHIHQQELRYTGYLLSGQPGQ